MARSMLRCPRNRHGRFGRRPIIRFFAGVRYIPENAARQTKLDGGVDEDGPAGGVAEEVTVPQIAVEEGRRFGWKEVRQALIEALEVPDGCPVQEALAGGEVDLGFETAVDEEVDPVGGGGVGLGKRAHVIVFGEAEFRLSEPVQSGELFAEKPPEAAGRRPDIRWFAGHAIFRPSMSRQTLPPETIGARALFDPFQHQQLMPVGLQAGNGCRHADHVLPAQ